MGAVEGAATGDAYRRADPGSVVLQAGRPLLVVARHVEQVTAGNVVVAWKDTREARRAVADYGLAIRLTECQQFDTNLGGNYRWCPLARTP